VEPQGLKSGRGAVSGSGQRLPAVNLSPHTAIIRCPKCGSQRAWKDGIRHTPLGEVQRYLCRDCAHRYSDPSWSENFERDQRFPSEVLNRCFSLTSTRQVCVSQTKAMINLAAVETRTQEKAAGATETQTATTRQKLLEYAWWLQKRGLAKSTVLSRSRLLKIMTKRGADLYDPETIKEVIAKQPWSSGRKNNAVDAYSSFLKMVNGKWNAPIYQGTRKLPFIPKETEIDQLIAGCSQRMATFLQTLKETGARCGEIWWLEWTNIDFEGKVVNVAPEKNSNPRVVHISNKLIEMLQKLPKNYGARVFSRPDQPVDHHARNFCIQRKRIAKKIGNPRLMQIHFHTLRYWKGTMLYHKVKDMYYVMQALGHKNIKNTLLYVQLEEALFQGEQDYISKVAKTEKEICDLIEVGFEYVTDFENTKIFRKRKL